MSDEQPHPFAISSTRIASGTRPDEATAPHADSLQPGVHVGDFEIMELIGQGGVSRVYRARQCSLDRVVALKVTSSGDHDSTTALEGRTMAALDHTNIVPVYSEQIVEGRRLLAMSFVPGPSLADMLARKFEAQHESDVLEGRTRNQFACETVRDVARALHHAHEHNVLHCDVKPANILFTNDGRPRLADFNVSVRESASTNQPLGGTLSYMSPEQLGAVLGISDDSTQDATQTSRLIDTVDGRSDVYSLGLVLFQMLTGGWPYQEQHAGTDALQAAAFLRAIRLANPPEFPAESRLTPGLRSIVMKSLDVTTDRYTSASDLAEDLNRHTSNRPLRFAEGEPPAELVGKFIRRQSRPIAVASVMAALSAAVFFALNRPAEDSPEPASITTQLPVSASATELEQLGSSLAADEKFTEAIPVLKQAVEKDHSLRVAWFNLGVAYFKTGDFTGSVAAFDEAVELGLKTSTVYAHRCAARLASGDQAGAEEDVRRAEARMTDVEQPIVKPLLGEYRRRIPR